MKRYIVSQLNEPSIDSVQSPKATSQDLPSRRESKHHVWHLRAWVNYSGRASHHIYCSTWHFSPRWPQVPKPRGPSVGCHLEDFVWVRKLSNKQITSLSLCYVCWAFLERFKRCLSFGRIPILGRLWFIYQDADWFISKDNKRLLRQAPKNLITSGESGFV